MKAEIKNGNLILSKSSKKKQSTVLGGHPKQDSGLAIQPQSSRRRWSPLAINVVLIVVALGLALVGTFGLRHNNLQMAKLRDQLVEVDKTGNADQVQQAARKLQNYVAQHMNATTGRVALQTLYNQAAEQAMEQSKPPEISTDVYQQATNDCKPQLVNYGYRSWASCVATRVGLNATTTLATAEVKAPDPDLYYVDYASARWSADIAGISLLLLTIVVMILLIRLAIWLAGRVADYCRTRPSKSVYRG